MRWIWICLWAAMAGSAAAQDWQPSAAQKASSVALVENYFAALDDGRVTEARGYFLPVVAARFTAEELAAQAADNSARYGDRIDFRVRGVNWAPNGANIGTGVAALVDVEGRTDQPAILCGTVTIVEMSPAAFQIYGVDETFVSLDLLNRMGADERRELLDRQGCRHLLTQ
ncbi:MAG: hypothetical protein AAF674_08370 [Pseudomonadota bacterium]